MYLVSNVLEIWKLVFHKYYRLFFLRLIAQLFTKILHELFCQFISWTNWVYSGKFLYNCWISCQVMADMENFYNDLILFNLYSKISLANCFLSAPSVNVAHSLSFSILGGINHYNWQLNCLCGLFAKPGLTKKSSLSGGCLGPWKYTPTSSHIF